MSKIKIDYIFSAGFRCSSPDTLKMFGLRPFSGPFDYLFIDIETVFKLMRENMKSFMKDIIVFNKLKQITYSIGSINELNKKHICYMAHDYNNINLRINTNFLDDRLSGNIYEWEKICIFHHHDICNKKQYDIISKRVDRFNKIIEKYSEKVCLFHITRILTISDINEYMNNIIRLKLVYSINTYIVIIICCDNLEDAYYFKEHILFIVKKVDPYTIQISTSGTDNNLNYENELNIMKRFLNFELVKIDEI